MIEYLVSYSTRGMSPNTMPAAPDDILHARIQGLRAFQPQMLCDHEASSKCCVYSTPVYREAFHHGFMGAATQYLQALMEYASDSLRTVFMKQVVTRGRINFGDVETEQEGE